MLPSRSRRSRFCGASGAIICLGFLCCGAIAADEKGSPKADSKAKATTGTKGKTETGKTKTTGMPGGIPLPIGHEAKGLVLPDYDTQGRLRARFEAGTAKRVDADRIQFTGLKMTTFNLEAAAPDLHIDMPDAMLDLNTRVISSSARTTVTRNDFNIAGDTMKFDTVGRTGTLVGNVKMVITDASGLKGKSDE